MSVTISNGFSRNKVLLKSRHIGRISWQNFTVGILGTVIANGFLSCFCLLFFAYNVGKV